MGQFNDPVKNKFLTNKKALARMLAELSEHAGPFEEILELFGHEEEILFAVLLQNAL